MALIEKSKNMLTVSVADEVRDELGKTLSHFLLLTYDSRLYLIYKVMERKINNIDLSSEAIESKIIDVLEEDGNFFDPIFLFFEVKPHFDFNSCVDRFVNQLEIVSTVIKRGNIDSESEYLAFREQRNIFRDKYDRAPAGSRPAGVKNLDIILESFERENPGVEDKYWPVVS